uniref:Uncharacterized protein n=1 Tax=Rhizophora mucronata TaxID=61149 RepID=A0A2P2J920_RHIMU
MADRMCERAEIEDRRKAESEVRERAGQGRAVVAAVASFSPLPSLTSRVAADFEEMERGRTEKKESFF